MTVKRYRAVASAAISLSDSGEYVKYEDYAALQAQVNALAAEVQAVRWASGEVYARGYNHGHLNTVDGLPYAKETYLIERGGEALHYYIDPDHCGVATDAVIREIKAQRTEKPTCEICGHPMPDGEEMFKFHGYSCPCPLPNIK